MSYVFIDWYVSLLFFCELFFVCVDLRNGMKMQNKEKEKGSKDSVRETKKFE